MFLYFLNNIWFSLTMFNLFKIHDSFVSTDDLKNVLQNLGIKKNDTLCIHAEVFKLGQFANDPKTCLEKIIDCFKEVVGENGTILMPTFTYSYCKQKDYDKKNSASTMGILSEFFRKQDNVVRTNDPIFSFAIFGKNKDKYLKDVNSCFGVDSVYDILRKEQGKIILFGTNAYGYTFSHYVEEQHTIPYRFFKTFSGKTIFEDGYQKDTSIEYYVRVLDRPSILVVKTQVDILKKASVYKEIPFSKSCIVCIDADKYFDVTMDALDKDENALLKEE